MCPCFSYYFSLGKTRTWSNLFPLYFILYNGLIFKHLEKNVCFFLDLFCNTYFSGVWSFNIPWYSSYGFISCPLMRLSLKELLQSKGVPYICLLLILWIDEIEFWMFNFWYEDGEKAEQSCVFPSDIGCHISWYLLHKFMIGLVNGYITLFQPYWETMCFTRRPGAN